ncbi:hypothetical protein [Butyrivibrio sp. INlla16]|uniref:hypothetical protein n=1 Tax=Butyrivibrio sp. INlla16 TaxID=1520807 RepID=UPI000885A7EC|nr:hypothetical protein [Butyrivibrio sp. INlla16]SDB47662.1 hypothetical protein SAMN02910263_02351 [Butyrivibrio sp. INlla16]
MSTVMMVAGICMLLCCGMGYYALLRIEGELSVAYSAITLIVVLQVFGLTAGISAGAKIYFALSLIGLLLFILKGRDRKGFFSVGVVAFIGLSLAGIVAFHGDFIQTYDDFHQWAAEVKYMYENNFIPVDGDFIGSALVPPETSLFSAFFQILGGYNEGYMYSSGFMLSAIAAVLPLLRLKWKDWYKGLLYVLLVYAGLFSLYVQPYKSLYVDVPCAMWAAGTCMVWYIIGGDKTDTDKIAASGNKLLGLIIRFRNGLLMIPLLVFVARIKWGVGLLMWLFTLAFIVIDSIERKNGSSIGAILKRRWKQGVAIIAIGIVLVAAVWFLLGESFIPANLHGVLEALTFSSKKARLTALCLPYTIFEKSLTSNPNMPFRAAQATIMITIIMAVMVSWCKEEAEKRRLLAQTIAFPIYMLLYIAGLYVSYVSVFSYEESIRNATGYRYLSIVVVFEYVIMSAFLLRRIVSEKSFADQSEGRAKRLSNTSLLGLAVLVLMISNFNEDIIFKGSSLHYWENPTYEKINRTKEQVEEIKTIIGEDDRVYMLSNAYSLENMNEYPLCVALYYMDKQVSNYLNSPWEFNKKGSYTFNCKTDTTIEEFPDMIKTGGYTYIWIHSHDQFLDESFWEMFNSDIEANGLYKVNISDTGDITLELVREL